MTISLYTEANAKSIRPLAPNHRHGFVDVVTRQSQGRKIRLAFHYGCLCNVHRCVSWVEAAGRSWKRVPPPDCASAKYAFSTRRSTQSYIPECRISYRWLNASGIFIAITPSQTGIRYTTLALGPATPKASPLLGEVQVNFKVSNELCPSQSAVPNSFCWTIYLIDLHSHYTSLEP